MLISVLKLTNNLSSLMTAMVFGYLMLMRDFFFILILCFHLSFRFDGEDISNTQDSVISRHLRVRSKRSAAHCIFTSCLGIWKCGQLLSFVFDILLTTPPQLDFHPVNGFFFLVGGRVGEKSLESMHSTSTQIRMPCCKWFLH